MIKNNESGKWKYYVIAFVHLFIALGILWWSDRTPSSAQKLVVAKKEVVKLQQKGEIKEGDIIFQTSQSAQSKAIQLATHSKYSHCGIVFRDSSGFYVLEAVQPVKHTPLDKWIARGQDGHYAIKRLKNANQALTHEVLIDMEIVGELFRGLPYDIYFGWSDDKIYCSELVWKIYQRGARIEVEKLQKLKDFDLSSDVVKKKMKERYGTHLPLEETVISPASIFDSELLETVKEE